MLGYVTIEKGELKVKDFDLYQAYYCGICKAIGKRLGQVPRMTLSYDAVFLAMVLDGLTDGEAKVLREHCAVSYTHLWTVSGYDGVHYYQYGGFV